VVDQATPSPVDEGRYVDVARFRAALRRFERRTDVAARRCGLTPRRYLLLLLVAARPADDPATVSTLVEDMEMPQSTVTDLVARAVENGLLERRPASADGRVTHLCLTAEGDTRLACAVDNLRSERAELRRTLVRLSKLI
jgi:DNA-binding MarR family transcriptional regulator